MYVCVCAFVCAFVCVRLRVCVCACVCVGTVKVLVRVRRRYDEFNTTRVSFAEKLRRLNKCNTLYYYVIIYASRRLPSSEQKSNECFSSRLIITLRYDYLCRYLLFNV